MRRVVVRPRVQIVLLLVIFGVFALIGLTFFTNDDVVARRDWFGIVLGAVCLLGGALGIWRSARLGTVIDATGVQVRGVDSRDRTMPWSEIESVRCEQVGARAGMPLFAPVIRLGGGGDLVIRPLSTYSEKDAERRTALLRQLGEGRMTGPVEPAEPAEPVSVEAVRRAPSYGRMLAGARLYAGGFAWLFAFGIMLTYADLDPWWLLLGVPAVPMIAVSVVLIRRAFGSLAQDLGTGTTEVPSAAVIASAGDLFWRRKSDSALG